MARDLGKPRERSTLEPSLLSRASGATMQRKTSLFTFAFAAAVGATVAAFTGCTSLLGDFEVGPDTTSEAGTGPGSNGATCTTTTECNSGFCSDGVCCESACSGTCESCNLGGDKGKCMPIPDGQDPDTECKATPREDAGAPREPDAAVLDDGGDSGTAPDAQVEQDDGGSQVNVPDAGVTSDDVKCAGSCNGNRACKYPAAETTCGTKFCNTSREAARFACDGKGRCELGLEACSSFTCENDECRKTCAEQNDCQSTHFCNQTGICQQKLANGLGCGNPDQCASGFCPGGAAGVCCNSDCDAIPGATCKQAGSVGKCQCSVNCGAGSCRLFYQDTDGDTYGDKNATFGSGTAVIGCDNASPPAGFSANKDDCDDGDNRAHPGQTGYFADTTATKGLNDFNCDGVISKETKEYPGASCFVCGDPTKCPASTKCAGRDTSQSRLTCDLYKNILIGTTYSCGYSLKVSNTAGFTSTVSCGATSATYTTCGKCSGATLASPPPSTVTSKQQRCR
jgi:hypothetical protein